MSPTVGSTSSWVVVGREIPWRANREEALSRFVEKQASSARSRDEFLQRLNAVHAALYAGQSSTASVLPNIMGVAERMHAAQFLVTLAREYAETYRWG